MKDYLLNLVSKVDDRNQKANIMREYLQVYALRAMFEKGRFAQLAFVGGTAFRFIYELPRFSEDLDFSLTNANSYDFINMLSEMEQSFKKANYEIVIKHNKDKTVNSAFLKFPDLMYLSGLSLRQNQNISIKIEVDTNPPSGASVTTSLVNKYFPITFSHYDLPSLFAGKLHAIFSRAYVKGRDYFDLVWILSRHKDLNPNVELLNAALIQSKNPLRVTKEDWRKHVLAKIETLNWKLVLDDVEKFSEDPLFINSMNLENAKKLLSI